MTHTIGDIKQADFVDVAVDDDIHVTGRIYDGAIVRLTSLTGSIRIDGDINEDSSVKLEAVTDIDIGANGGKDINGSSSVEALSSTGTIRVHGKIDGSSTVKLHAWDDVNIGSVTGGNRRIDGSSYVVATSQRRDVHLTGRVDGDSRVVFSANRDVRIEEKIVGKSDARLRAGRAIVIGGQINDESFAEMTACSGISVGGWIDGASTVRMAVRAGTIEVGGQINGSGTVVTYWPSSSLNVVGGIYDGTITDENWAGDISFCIGKDDIVGGSLIRDWGWTHAYITTNRLIPRTLRDLVSVVQTIETDARAKARGGGWSFGDTSLPFAMQGEVDRVSMVKRGEGGEADFRHVLDNMPSDGRSSADLHPQRFERARSATRRYNALSLREEYTSGFDMPGASNRYLVIDTRGLSSVLQNDLENVLSTDAVREKDAGRHLFWVEGGITIADLNTVLDHQKPRLAIQASGGSPGATLAGTISTATHGGELKWPLLVDMVKAIHLVGPGGEEWWIEGDDSIVNYSDLSAIYPNIPEERFVAGSWTGPEHIKPVDVLKSLVVSMGTMGVIYSIIFEVKEQYGIEQRTVAIKDWNTLLAAVGVTEDQLRANNTAANEAVLKFISDGAWNGTDIALDDNVYVDLAMNPLNRACWIVNRQLTNSFPDDPDPLPADMGHYLDTAAKMLGRNSQNNRTHYLQSKMYARILEFLGQGTGPTDIINNFKWIMNAASFVTSNPPVTAAAFALGNVRAMQNVKDGGHAGKMHMFLADILDSVLHGLQGTGRGLVASTTGLSHKVGAIGWPDDGIPGGGVTSFL